MPFASFKSPDHNRKRRHSQANHSSSSSMSSSLTSSSVPATGIPCDLLVQLESQFSASGQLQLAELATQRHKLFDVSLDRRLVDELSSTSAFALAASEVKPVTDQKRSGRCWLFAALNMARIPLAKQLGLAELEFSQSHLFFWDKLERGYYFLHCYLDCALRGEPLEGRLWQHLLQNPAEDGGQWDMIVNLVEKHGIIPKQCWTEPMASQETLQLNFWLNTWHRQSAKRIRDLHIAGQSAEQIRAYIDGHLLPELFRICCAAIGRPPARFTFEYATSGGGSGDQQQPEGAGGSSKYRRIGPITPLEFYRQHVKPVVDLGAQVCLVNDPRNPYYRLMTVDMLNNMQGARRVLYVNLPSAELRRLATEALRDRLPVWFGSHVSKGHSRTAGLADPNLHRVDLLFGCQLNLMDKKERLLYADSLMTHAMLLTGVTPPDPAAGTLGKWRVENSWSQDYGLKGYLTVTDAWFDEYVYEVAIDRARLTDEMRAVLEQDPIVLPAWDPMGALAQ